MREENIREGRLDPDRKRNSDMTLPPIDATR
jgi:hypothetical protein